MAHQDGNELREVLGCFFAVEPCDVVLADIRDMRVSVSEGRYCTLEYKYGLDDRTLKIGRSLSGSEYEGLYSYGFALYENSRLSCFETWELNGTEGNVNDAIAELLNRILRYPGTRHPVNPSLVQQNFPAMNQHAMPSVAELNASADPLDE